VAAPTESTRRAYRIASWISAGLAFVAAVLTVGFGLATVVGTESAGDGGRLKTGPAPSAQKTEVLAADQSVITGTLTKLVGTKVSVAPALALPLTLTVARGGGTKADFSGGAVGGKNATLSWDGGRPLPISGQGSIDLNGPINFEVAPTGITWALDGVSRLLTPGSYTFGATVAVTPLKGGLGTPKEGARLDVPAGAAASLQTRGDVRVTTPPAALSLQGPGELVLEGALDVRTRDGVRPARKITFGPGAFDLSLEPQPGGFRVTKALLQGPTAAEE